MTEDDQPASRLAEQRRQLLERMSAPPGQREGLFPATAALRSMWVAQQLRPGASMYHMPALLRVRGPLDADRLATALQQLTAAHEALRTTLIAVDGDLLQHVHALRGQGLAVIDATGRPADAVIAEAIEAAHDPFDLSTGSALRATLWRLTDTDHLLLLVLHHTAADAWSLGVLLADLAAAVSANGSPPAIPGIQPADIGLGAHGAGPDGTGFWAGYLAGAANSASPSPVAGTVPRRRRLPRSRHAASRRCPCPTIWRPASTSWLAPTARLPSPSTSPRSPPSASG